MRYATALLFLLCRRVAPTTWITEALRQRLVLWVVDIQGACRHSGNCCQAIRLYDRGVPITTVSNWGQFLKKNPELTSFTPTMFNGEIQSFDCHHLTNDRRCDNYPHRPSLCRNYPTSDVLSHGHIREGCGYTIYVHQDRLNQLPHGARKLMASFLGVRA